MSHMIDLKPDALGSPIESEDQARNWIIELVQEVEYLRVQCDNAPLVKDPDRHKVQSLHGPMVKDQRTWFLRWGHARSKALGVVDCLKRCRMVSDVTYQELKKRILATTVPSVRKGMMPEVWDQ